jgi:hypothetical protein
MKVLGINKGRISKKNSDNIHDQITMQKCSNFEKGSLVLQHEFPTWICSSFSQYFANPFEKEQTLRMRSFLVVPNGG